MALSARGRGANGAPSGVTTSFRPQRFLNVIGTWVSGALALFRPLRPSPLHELSPVIWLVAEDEAYRRKQVVKFRTGLHIQSVQAVRSPFPGSNEVAG